MKEVKKMINAKLKRHLAKPHALLHEIYIYIDDHSFMIGLYHTYKISIDFFFLIFILKKKDIAIVFILKRIQAQIKFLLFLTIFL